MSKQYQDGRDNSRFQKIKTSYLKITEKYPSVGDSSPKRFFDGWKTSVRTSYDYWQKNSNDPTYLTLGLLQALSLEQLRITDYSESNLKKAWNNGANIFMAKTDINVEYPLG